MSTLSAHFGWEDVRLAVIAQLRSKMPPAALPASEDGFDEFSLDEDGASIEWQTPEPVKAPVSIPFPRD